MKALESDLVAYVDVDECLVTMFGSSSVFPDFVNIPRGVFIWRNTALIEKIYQHKRRGHAVIVWSAGGWKWAKEIVDALGLTDYVDLCLSKPRYCYDDKDPADFIPKPTRPDEK